MTDVDKVIQHFQDAIEASGKNNKWRFVRLDIIEDTIALLKKQPEIIRCKDCKYGEHMCQPWSDIVCTQNRATHIPDWFCADGERK